MDIGSNTIPFDEAVAEALLMRFLAVEGVTGHEAAIAAEVSAALVEAGAAQSAIKYDEAHKRIPLPTETGNLIATLPGTRPGPRLLFSTHLDTVPLCAGAKPKREGDRIVNETAGAALGGDNRTGCAVLVAMVETLLKHNLPHPPITLLFTVREESGLHGARELDAADLSGAEMGFNVDAQVPANFVIGAVGQVNWQAEIRGKASHAGVAPEKGISSTLVASIALAEVHQKGWFGKIDRAEGKGTSNPGIFEGKPGASAGDATNVVTDYVHIVGEARSFDEAFAAQIASAYEAAFETGRQAVADSSGNHAEVKFTAKPSYPPFQLPEDSPAVERAKRAAASLGLPATTLHSNGGFDANWLVRHGVPAVTIGAGQHEIHTVNEYVELPQFFDGCRLAVALATLDD